jgi:alkylation response protein AidB-like acyl-CoA dehydrogenase
MSEYPEGSMVNMNFAGQQFDSLLIELEELAGQLESSAEEWPTVQIKSLTETGVLGWVIPKQYGGAEISQTELTAGYEKLATACLTTAFVLTQRNGACQRIAGCENNDLKADLLPDLCSGETFATVGVSHLTTSRQYLKKPAVQVRLTDSDVIFNGTVPWVTGANHADYIVTGGTCDDGTQVLATVPTAHHGITLNQPTRLLALNASQTGSVELQDVDIPRRFLIAGPIEGVMKRGTGGGTGSLTTSSLAIGAAECSLNRLKQETENRPDLVEIYEPMAAERKTLSVDLLQAAAAISSESNPALQMESIRQRANSLVIRAAQASLGAAKGAGFVHGHPAERAVREAMFFLVWSCPQPVLTAALREFACVLEA